MAIINDKGDVLYEGKVLAKWVDNNYRIMSDVWGAADMAMVWEDKLDGPQTVAINVFEYSRPADVSKIEVDATEEVKTKYKNWLYNKFHLEVKGEYLRLAKVLKKDDMVEIVAGRQHKGDKGKVVAIIDAKYNMGWKTEIKTKVLVAFDDETFEYASSTGKVYQKHKNAVWVWAHNVEKLNIVLDMDEIDRVAKFRVDETLKRMNIS